MNALETVIYCTAAHDDSDSCFLCEAGMVKRHPLDIEDEETF